jgi:hypothetical protein
MRETQPRRSIVDRVPDAVTGVSSVVGGSAGDRRSSDAPNLSSRPDDRRRAVE